jgi:phage recombination protein Bet
MNMTKEIALVNFNEEQIALIKSQIAPKATDSELQLFLYQAKRTGLDPLTRQIYAIHRACKENVNGIWVWVNKMSIQTSIDGFRVIAERSGDYAGQDEPIFTEEGIKLISCKVTVYRFRGDVRYPAAVGVAYWLEYVQVDKEGNTAGLWKKMPHTMLAKVAEALALRKAYPQDLSGLYTSDEMNQADEIKTDSAELKIAQPTKNAFGLSKDGDLASGVDMTEIQKKANQDDFAGLKTIIENCASIEELQTIWMDKKNVAIVNKLKKYELTLYDLLIDAKDTMKAELTEAEKPKTNKQ